MLTGNNQIFRNCFVIIYCHLTKVLSQINKCIIFELNELSITLSTLWWCSTWTVCASAGNTRCSAWSHIGILMCRFAGESSSTAGLLFSYQIVFLERSCWHRIQRCGTGWFQEQGQCFFFGLSCPIPVIVFYYFSLSLLSVYWLVL